MRNRTVNSIFNAVHTHEHTGDGDEEAQQIRVYTRDTESKEKVGV